MKVAERDLVLWASQYVAKDKSELRVFSELSVVNNEKTKPKGILLPHREGKMG